MDQQLYDFGMIGLGVMGRNFLLNVADDGFGALGTDINEESVSALNEEGKDMRVKGVATQQEFVQLLSKPRKIMLLVPAGSIVDKVIEGLLPLLDKDDIIIDGGNSHYEDTDRRYAYLKTKNIRFLGTGVSGGAKGARLGPSIMPGGDRSAWEDVKPILETVAAKVNGEPCVTYIGESSSGHYVKMVHNGIEYGLMQLIAEAYDILKRVGGMSNDDMSALFSKWNDGRLNSYLVEISANILKYRIEDTDEHLLDLILDKAKQKGTGKWTSQSAMDLGVPIPTIDAAVTMRAISAFKEYRQDNSKLYKDIHPEMPELTGPGFAESVEKALYFGFVTCYAQGMQLLAEASKEMKYDLDLEGIARIWRGGCIIRAEMLEKIRHAYGTREGLFNMMATEEFRHDLFDCRESVVELLHQANERGVPAMCLSTSLQYFEVFRSERLPLNMVQAQRDYFGSHTYERTDQTGVFHTAWDARSIHKAGDETDRTGPGEAATLKPSGGAKGQ
ncbi:6-phosphogluconate dehydrogenase, NADP(+)-dependent, decarboxylating [Neolewinella maritima]|uniref:6-phosphogluconate dehydrogenase, decarboxylating n=1 Tax=Neolewinella maritima TaxID=1383882 RepID=A0ABM9B265_9BACT|nr:NADP-dependent phosphogluconate dehydrogenase [Neolewinella maritima]CAH1001423.1 6-phosphogluconate dehydrogenase, NADP(+)-dependent, decarboxylating [Neolewinella maritima]